VTKISVVVPCYNHERYVERCLSSIDMQDHADLEVIVVDDGSRDASWQRISAHRWQPSRHVRLLRRENRGAHAAFNEGLHLATGDYVALCNSDDWFARARISALHAGAQRSSARFAFLSGVRFVDDAEADVTYRLPYAIDLHGSSRRSSAFRASASPSP